MRFHLFDPQLGADDGHYLDYDSAIVDELSRRSVPCFVYGSSSPPASFAAPFEVERVFSRSIFAETGRDPTTWALENFDDNNAAFSCDLSALHPSRFESGDLAFFPSITQNQIVGLRQWLSRLPDAHRPAVAVKPGALMHLMPYMQNRPNKDLTALLFRHAIRRLVAEHPSATICTDTEELVDIIKQIGEVPVHLLPLPLSIPDPESVRESSERPCCAFIGHASPLKGYHFLPEITASFQSVSAAPRFLIQSYGDPGLRGPVEASLRSLGEMNVSLVTRTLARGDYLALLHRADILMLPYAREFYGWASSGIFVEALSLAKIVIIPEGTWMARQAARFDAGHVVFRDWNAESVAGAIHSALDAFPSLTQKAVMAAPAWRRIHSPANYVDRLLGAVGR